MRFVEWASHRVQVCAQNFESTLQASLIDLFGRVPRTVFIDMGSNLLNLIL